MTGGWRERVEAAYSDGVVAVCAVVDDLLDNARHTVRGRCRYCGGEPKPGPDHRESCSRYRGPLGHEWVRKSVNPTFGGIDYYCRCGGWFRLGGLAGHGDGSADAIPVCPRVEERAR